LFITGDGSQGLYRERSKRFSWKSKGIRAQGRTEYLHENYRNAATIYQLATTFSGPAGFGEIEGEPHSLATNQSHPSARGGNIFVVREKDRVAEISKAVNLAHELIAGQWQTDGVADPMQFHFADIGIIYPTHKNLEGLIADSLIPRLKAECKVPAVWISDPVRANRSDFSPAIRVQTIHHAKGLQYRAVIFMWADLLPFAQGRDAEQDRKLFYVALTRATEFLTIIHSGSSSFLKEAYAELEKTKPTGWLGSVMRSMWGRQT